MGSRHVSVFNAEPLHQPCMLTYIVLQLQPLRRWSCLRHVALHTYDGVVPRASVQRFLLRHILGGYNTLRVRVQKMY